MSKVIEHRNRYTGVLNTVVECNGLYYIVDSRRITPYYVYKTTVFVSGDYKQFVNWKEVFTKTYDNEFEMVNEHASICNDLERYIK